MTTTRIVEKPKTADEYRALLLSFIGSLTLCDHMGDVSDDVSRVLKLLDVDVKCDEWNELGSRLGKMGVTTLYGTTLSSTDDEGGDE